MARGGKRPGAGRRPGAASKINAEQKRTLTQIARDHTEDAIRTLTSIMLNKDAPAAARATAANSVLDRGWGKPSQAHEHTGAGGGPIQSVDLTHMSEADIDRLESIFGPLAGSGDDDEIDPGGEGETGSAG